MGLYEVAQLAHVSPAAVGNWRVRFEDFPKPVGQLKSGPVFDEREIREWLRNRRKNVRTAFVIMQIGDPDLDCVFEQVIAPAIMHCGLSPRRIDRHTEGELLKSEIVKLISTSDIIVADLTNGRPNCYLEIGYAMGIDKYKSLILTAREDHHPDSPKYHRSGPKVHFDLSGYDILFWSPERFADFKVALQRKIAGRLAILMPKKTTVMPEVWIQGHQEKAFAGLKASGCRGCMQLRITVPDSYLDFPQSNLVEMADRAAIHAFGWPLVPVLLNRTEYKPRPVADGVVCEISSGDYTYWALRRNGDLYLLQSLFEDERAENTLFFDTRIVRITEALLYIVRLYTAMGVASDGPIIVEIIHQGLSQRILRATNPSRYLSGNKVCYEDENITRIETSITEIQDPENLSTLVARFCDPLFMLFDYFKLDRSVLEGIVDNFVQGRIS